MLSNRTGRWSLGAVLLCAALVAASWFLLISPRRADASDLRAKTDQASSQADQLQLQIAQLKADFADLPRRREELRAIKAQLPAKTDMPALIRTFYSQAKSAGVDLKSITPGVPVVVTEPGVAAPPTAGAGSVVSVPVSLVVEGDYFEGSLYLKNLQAKITRSFLIAGLDASPAVVVPTPTPTPAVTATPTPTPAPTATPSPTPTPSPSATTQVVAVPDLSHMSLTVNGAVFVLLDSAVTLDDVAAQVKAAIKGGSAATGAGGTAAAAGGTSTS
jgi:Tfp pilus assembly protein PilO